MSRLPALLLVPLPAAPPFPPREQLLAAVVLGAVVVGVVGVVAVVVVCFALFVC